MVREVRGGSATRNDRCEPNMIKFRRGGLSVVFGMLLGLGPLFALSGAAEEGNTSYGAALAQDWCSNCHAVGIGAETQDTAPPFIAIAERRSDGYLRVFLADPHGPMEGFDLPSQEIEDLVAYIASLRTQ